MIIDETINVRDSHLTNGLIPVIKIMSKVAKSQDETLEMDFAHTKFISPVFALSLIVFLSGCGKKYSLTNLTDYLSVIGFSSGGIRPDQMRRSEFLATMEAFMRKKYIPIVNFPAKSFDDEKDYVSSVIENVIIKAV